MNNNHHQLQGSPFRPVLSSRTSAPNVFLLQRSSLKKKDSGD